jgi:Ca2+-binding RTX toxin-like protein
MAYLLSLLVMTAVLSSPLLMLAGAANPAFASDIPTFCGLPVGAFASAIPGTEGDDKMYGMGGNDRMYGGPGNDRMFGDAGADELYGRADNDVLYDEVGDDLLNGGNGADGCSDPMGANKVVECEGP